MESKQNKSGKICLYCFLVVAAILSIIAFIFTLSRKCDENFAMCDECETSCDCGSGPTATCERRRAPRSSCTTRWSVACSRAPPPPPARSPGPPFPCRVALWTPAAVSAPSRAARSAVASAASRTPGGARRIGCGLPADPGTRRVPRPRPRSPGSPASPERRSPELCFCFSVG